MIRCVWFTAATDKTQQQEELWWWKSISITSHLVDHLIVKKLEYKFNIKDSRERFFFNFHMFKIKVNQI